MVLFHWIIYQGFPFLNQKGLWWRTMVVKSGCKGAAVWGGEEVTSAHPSCTEWRVRLSYNFLNNLQPNVHRGRFKGLV